MATFSSFEIPPTGIKGNGEADKLVRLAVKHETNPKVTILNSSREKKKLQNKTLK